MSRATEIDGDGWLDDDDPLTYEQKALLDARLADMEQDPDASIPWEEVRRSPDFIESFASILQRRRKAYEKLAEDPNS